jgi:hypothetical protein
MPPNEKAAATGDDGFAFGEHGLFDKRTAYVGRGAPGSDDDGGASGTTSGAEGARVT